MRVRSHIHCFGDVVWLFSCEKKKKGPVRSVQKLSHNSHSFTVSLPLTEGISPILFTYDGILQRFSIRVSLWWHMTPKARNVKWHFSRILPASFFIQGHGRDTWSRRGESRKGTLSFKLSVQLSAQDVFQNCTTLSEKNFVRGGGQSL